MERVLCNICEKDLSRILFKIKDQNIAAFNIVECQNCGLVYMNPRFSPLEIEAFYDEDYFVFEDIQQMRQIVYAKEAIKDIIKFKQKGELLDVGSAKGLFLLIARKHGFAVHGLEISKYAADFTQEAFDIQTSIGTLENVDLKGKQYDVITMFDVIEHFQNPMRSMLKIRKALKDNGILIVDTPNIESMYSKLKSTNWQGYGRFHLYYFSHDTLIRLLRKAGFEPLSVTSPKHDVISFDALWRWGLISYKAYTRLEQIFILSKLAPNIGIPIKSMYDNKRYEEINDVVDKQITEVLRRRSVIKELFRWLNSPFDGFLDRRHSGDALRVIAQKVPG